MSHSFPAWASTAAGVALLFGLGVLLNLPFGWLRARARRLSFAWFLYVHLPIPLLFVLRHMLGLSYWAVPFSLGGAVLGQLAGGRLRSRFVRKRPDAVGVCTCCPLPAPAEQP